MGSVKKLDKDNAEHAALLAEAIATPGPFLDGRASLSFAAPYSSVSLEAEVPEALFEGMREFIRNHPHWDQYSVITSALAGFLFQNGSCDSTVKDHYLASLFSEP